MNLPKPTLGLSGRCGGETARNSALANERKARAPRADFSYGWITTGWEARVGKSDRKPVQGEDQRSWSGSTKLPHAAWAAWCRARSQLLQSEQNGRSGNAGLQRIGCANGPPLEKQKTAPRPPQGWLGIGMLSGATFLASRSRSSHTCRTSPSLATIS
jgi:hypothetical protein